MMASILGMNVGPLSARTTAPVGNINGGALLPTGQIITPAAAPGSSFGPLPTGLRKDGNADAAEAVTTALSPDGKTLLVVTSGYNLNFNDETTGKSLTYPVLDPTTGKPTTTTTSQAEWVFVYDVTSGTLVKKQQINIPNTYIGLTWAPDSQRFYVSGGIDDRVYVYSLNGGQYTPDAPFILLGHNSNQTAPFPSYDGGLLKNTPAGKTQPAVVTGAAVSGIAVSQDGKILVATNFENDSISIVDTSTRKVIREVQFFKPGSKEATGEFPYYVAIKSDKNGAAVTAYVTSQRDDQVLVVDIASGNIVPIAVGDQPNKLLLSPDQNLLYVANGNSDTISIISTNTNSVVQTISISRPGDKYKGANPNSLALSPDGATLYVTLGTENAIAVVDLKGNRVTGRIPTGWYPNSVSVSQDGQKLYVVNAKSNSGPNPANSRTTTAGTATNTTFRNEYTWALEKAGIAVIPVPDRGTLAALSRQVDQNNGLANRRPDPMMTFLNSKIKHVVYIIKENRTYDQILGDLSAGNGDPTLALFPQAITPNHHQLALSFGVLDNFYDSGESSGVGWNWSTYGRTTEYTEKAQSVNYGNSNGVGLTYDYEGTNRNINIALPQISSTPTPLTERVTGILDPTGSSSILPGAKDISAPEGDGDLDTNTVGGYIWDAALRAGKTVRNYGFFIDLAYYGTSISDPTQTDPSNPLYIPISPTPFAAKIPQSAVAKVVLQDKTDIYYRGYDNKAPDIYRYNEWARDFAQNGLAELTLVRIMHDHFGNFNQALYGLNTASLQMSDNDYALGSFVQAISNTPEWKAGSVAIFVIEDDSQNGADHIDSHRSLGYIISPYTRKQAPTVISTNYNTTNMLRTIEDLLGLDRVDITDASAAPMSDVFTTTPDTTPYTAIVPGSLCNLPVTNNSLPPLVPACNNARIPKTPAIASRHDGKWWAQKTKGFDFSVEDKNDADEFNRIVWAGIMGDRVPYPTQRSRANLRQNRAQLLKQWNLSENQISAVTNK